MQEEKRPPDIETLMARMMILINKEWDKSKGDIEREIEILRIMDEIRNIINQSIEKLSK